MKREEAILRIEDKYLNVGRILSDSELLNLGPKMNAEYLRLMGRKSNRDEFGLVTTEFERKLMSLQEELQDEGFDLSDKYDKKLYTAELNARLLKWAKEWRMKQK